MQASTTPDWPIPYLNICLSSFRKSLPLPVGAWGINSPGNYGVTLSHSEPSIQFACLCERTYERTCEHTWGHDLNICVCVCAGLMQNAAT